MYAWNTVNNLYVLCYLLWNENYLVTFISNRNWYLRISRAFNWKANIKSEKGQKSIIKDVVKMFRLEIVSFTFPVSGSIFEQISCWMSCCIESLVKLNYNAAGAKRDYRRFAITRRNFISFPSKWRELAKNAENIVIWKSFE